MYNKRYEALFLGDRINNLFLKAIAITVSFDSLNPLLSNHRNHVWLSVA